MDVGMAVTSCREPAEERPLFADVKLGKGVLPSSLLFIQSQNLPDLEEHQQQCCTVAMAGVSFHPTNPTWAPRLPGRSIRQATSMRGQPLETDLGIFASNPGSSGQNSSSSTVSKQCAGSGSTTAAWAHENCEKACRICYGGEEEEPLLRKCACQGSSRWVHGACLEAMRRSKMAQWYRSQTAGGDTGSFRCGQCGTGYHDALSLELLRQKLAQDNSAIALTNLGWEMYKQNKFDDAIDPLQDAYDRYHMTLGEQHHETRAAKVKLDRTLTKAEIAQAIATSSSADSGSTEGSGSGNSNEGIFKTRSKSPKKSHDMAIDSDDSFAQSYKKRFGAKEPVSDGGEPALGAFRSVLGEAARRDCRDLPQASGIPPPPARTPLVRTPPTSAKALRRKI